MVAFGVGLATLAAFQQFKLPPVLPTLLQLYDYDRSVAAGFMSVYALAGLLLSLPLGRFMHRHGAAPFLYLAFALLTGATMLAVVAPADGRVMLAARGLEGIAFAICAISGPAFANLSASPRQLPLVVALTAVWIPIGQLAATLLAPVALAVGHWWWLWAAGLIATAAMALWTRALERRGRLDRKVGEPGPEAGRAAAAAKPWSAAQKSALLLGAGMFMMWSGQYFAYMTWLPQFLVEAHGLTEVGAIGGYALPVTILLVVVLLTGVALREGVPFGPLLVGAMVSQAILWWLVPLTTGPVTGITALVAYGIGAGIVPTCLLALPSVALGRARAGPQAFAVLMTGRNVGVLAGPILLAEGYKLTESWTAAVPIFGTGTTIAAVMAAYLAVRMRRGGRRG